MDAHEKYLLELEIQRLCKLTESLMSRVLDAEAVIGPARVVARLAGPRFAMPLQLALDAYDAGRPS